MHCAHMQGPATCNLTNSDLFIIIIIIQTAAFIQMNCI